MAWWCFSCCNNCAEVLYASFDCGNCDSDNTCQWWDQIVASYVSFDFGTGQWTTSNGTVVLGPFPSIPGPPACIALQDDGSIKVIIAGYVHMLPNSGSVTATINGNAAYGWYYYTAGTFLTCTYQIPTSGNICLYCHSDPEDCTFTVNDVTPHIYPHA